jgi:hypothetical protein
VVKGVSARPAWADLTQGHVKITVTFNEAVAVHGTPALTLNDGGTASHMPPSRTNTLSSPTPP